MDTTLTISKTITRIATSSFGSMVSTHKIGDFSKLLSNLNVVTISGTTSANKLAKFQKQLTALGFIIESTAWLDESSILEGCYNFNITYKK